MNAQPDARTAPLRTLGLAVCIAFAVLYLWCATQSFRASVLASSLDVASLERAIALQPRQAGYQDLLCRFLMFDRQEVAAAVPHCERATELNPYYSPYWLHLALAYHGAGAQAQQQQAIRKALEVDPTTPDVAWNAANFFLVQNQVPEALRQFATVIRNDPNRVTPALDLCWRAVHDENEIEALLPPDPDAYLKFVRLLITKNQWEAARRAWSSMLRLNRKPAYQHALFYVDALIDKHDVADANQAWQQLASSSNELRRRSEADNMVLNGGFEEEILNGGFDWHYWKHNDSTVSRETTDFHSGNRSVSISYRGRNDDSGLFQYVPVKPNTQYMVSSWVKSDGLKSGSGICVAVTDAYSDKVFAQTQETLGTTEWHRVESSFQTGPDTELVVVRFAHAGGNLWVEGQFWADDVNLSPRVESVHAQ